MVALVCSVVLVVAAENPWKALVAASSASQQGPDRAASWTAMEPQPKIQRLLGNENVAKEPGSTEKRPLLVSPATMRSKQQQKQHSRADRPRHMQEKMLPLRSYTYGNIHQTAYYFAGELSVL